MTNKNVPNPLVRARLALVLNYYRTVVNSLRYNGHEDSVHIIKSEARGARWFAMEMCFALRDAPEQK